MVKQAQTAPATDGAKADAMHSAAVTEEQRKAAAAAKLVEVKATFADFGLVAAKGDGVTTEMARYYSDLCRGDASYCGHAMAGELYKPYIEAYNAHKGGDVSDNSRAAGLSIFATFGTQEVVAVLRAVGDETETVTRDGAKVDVRVTLYDHIVRIRDSYEEKSETRGSAYTCFAKFNREVKAAVEGDGGAKHIVAILSDADKRAAWLREKCVEKEGGAAKSWLDKLDAAIKAVNGLAKREDAAAVRQDVAELVKHMGDMRERMVAKRNAAKSELATLLTAEQVNTAQTLQ